MTGASCLCQNQNLTSTRSYFRFCNVRGERCAGDRPRPSFSSSSSLLTGKRRNESPTLFPWVMALCRAHRSSGVPPLIVRQREFIPFSGVQCKMRSERCKLQSVSLLPSGRLGWAHSRTLARGGTRPDPRFYFLPKRLQPEPFSALFCCTLSWPRSD